MKKLVILLLLSAAAWSAMDDTWASGAFTGKDENYTVNDAVIVFWPQMGVQKNVLEANLFANKLSPADRKAYIDRLSTQKVEDVQALFDSKNTQPKPRYLAGARLQLSFGYQKPPTDFSTAQVSNGGYCVYPPSGGFIGSTLPINTSYKFSYSNGSSHSSSSTKISGGLQLKISGQNRAGDMVNFQSEFHSSKKDDQFESKDYKVQVITPLVVCTL